MGNIQKTAYDMWWGWTYTEEDWANMKKENGVEGYDNKMKAMEERMNVMEIENKMMKEQTEAEKKKKEEAEKEEINNILNAGLDPDMWDLLRFMEGQGKDTSNIKKDIANVLKNHKSMGYHELTGGLESCLSIHKPFDDMTKAISIALETGLLSLPDYVEYDKGLEQSLFTVEVGKIAAAVTAATTTAASAGTILAAVLGQLKDIEFFSSKVQTYKCRNQSLSIVEVRSSDSNSAVVLFEIARVSISLRNVKGHVVFAGSEASTARVSVCYGRGTVALKDLFPNEQERSLLIAKLQKTKAERSLFLRQQYMKRNIQG